MQSASTSIPQSWRSWLKTEVDQFSFKLGCVGVAIVVVFALMNSVSPPLGIVAAMAALRTFVAGIGVAKSDRLRAATAFTILGFGITIVAQIVGRHDWPSVVATGVVAFVSCIGLVVGPMTGRIATVLTLWFLFVVQQTQSEFDPAGFAIGFLIGGAIVTAIYFVLDRTKYADSIEPKAFERLPTSFRNIADAMTWDSAAFRFAVVYAFTVAFALALGWRVFPNNPTWIPITTVALLHPNPRKALSAGYAKLIGVLFGVAIVIGIFAEIESRPFQFASLIVLAFLMGGSLLVSEELFTTFMTALMLATIALAGGDIETHGLQWLAETVIGLGIAIAAMWLLRWSERRNPTRGWTLSATSNR